MASSKSIRRIEVRWLRFAPRCLEAQKLLCGLQIPLPAEKASRRKTFAAVRSWFGR